MWCSTSSDIFALQDEISEAIVKALKLRLLPAEKKAIERRGTDNAEAHNLYLMARQTLVTGQEYDARAAEAFIRISAHATEIDPDYEGKGLGRRLVESALDDVASKGGTVVPLCPFFRAYIRRNDEYDRLVDHEILARIERSEKSQGD